VAGIVAMGLRETAPRIVAGRRDPELREAAI
jgi:hypothetical protein